MQNYSNQDVTDVLNQFLGPVMTILDEPNVEEVMINTPSNIWVEQKGEMSKLDCQLSKEAVFGAISLLGRLEGKDVASDSEDAILDAQLGGYRVAAALEPIAVHGHSMCIRRHSTNEVPLEKFPVLSIDKNAKINCPDPTTHFYEWLSWVVANKKTVLISGGTSTGKTTFMRSLIKRGVDGLDRLIFIEDVPELHIKAANEVCFRVNEQIGITTSSLVRLALRYRPDRIIIGEVRGAEAFDLMQAINTGHEGSVASIHANSAFEALSRLETLVLTANANWPLAAIRMQVATTIDYIVQMSRTKKTRAISEVIQISGYEDDGAGYIYEKIV